LVLAQVSAARTPAGTPGAVAQAADAAALAKAKTRLPARGASTTGRHVVVAAAHIDTTTHYQTADGRVHLLLPGCGLLRPLSRQQPSVRVVAGPRTASLTPRPPYLHPRRRRRGVAGPQTASLTLRQPRLILWAAYAPADDGEWRRGPIPPTQNRGRRYSACTCSSALPAGPPPSLPPPLPPPPPPQLVRVRAVCGWGASFMPLGIKANLWVGGGGVPVMPPCRRWLGAVRDAPQ
jgi:hypothetical protein